jgi:multidrug resistance efflux pump/acetyl esterase/lipase
MANDEGPAPAEEEILHRTLADGSGQDYFVYRPPSVAADGPLFVAIHDISRNAHGQAAAFAGVCARYGATLVVPHFPASRYPNYQRLGRSRNSLDSGKRADEALDTILQEVAALDGVAPERICLFGYGAGGRFAMRYTMAHPERVAAVVIVSPGTYTLPSVEKSFPQGIGPSSKRMDLRFEPREFLQVPMTVLEVVDEGNTLLRRPVEVVRSSGGTSRERGRKWVAAMRSAAHACQLASQVSYREIEGSFESFEAFVERGSLPDLVFEALPGPLSGLPVVYTQSALPDRIRDRGGSLGLRDATDAVFEAAAAGPARIPPIVARGVLVTLLMALLVPLGLWIHYRSTNVVSRDAVVRSHIADVGARVDGVVKSVEVDAGDHVRAGQVVARIEDSNFKAKVAQAASQLERAIRKLEVERLAIENERQRLSSSLRGVSADFSAARAGVQAAESRAEEAQRQVELQKSLVSKGLVPAERARSAETELRTALALVAESRAEASAAGAGADLARVESNGLSVREKRISVLESEIAALRADLAAAEANLEGTVIRAPDDGAVVRRIVQPGGSTTVGQPIIALWVGEQIWVEAWVDEDDLADIGVGSPAVVTFKSYPDREFTGVVESLGVSTDFELPDSAVPQPRSERMRSTPLISARIQLDDPADDLFPGLSAVVGIRKKTE